jgi:copper homeostasis protein
MTRSVLLEVCVDSADGCAAALAGGADRVELCASLDLGGTTPSIGALLAGASTRIPIMAMIRPRAGDFMYSKLELESMQFDIATAKQCGARGVVLGVLRPDGTVDAETTRALVELARPMQVTFHRAFDMTRDLDEALDALIEIGVDRVLTSGGEASVVEGLERIASLVRKAGERIVVMPGGGVREGNIRRVIDVTGAREAHFSAQATATSQMLFRNPRCTMGSSHVSGEYERSITATERIRSVIGALTKEA